MSLRLAFAFRCVLSPSGFLLAGILMGLYPAATRAGSQVLTPYDVARLRSVTAAVISPDGKHIAYVLSVPRRPFEQENGPPWAELHVVDPAGVSRPFVTGEVNVGAVAWTPDGKGISFLAKRGKDEHEALYVIPIDGGEARKVLEHETDIVGYSWSPDGRRVAFLATDKEPESKKELKEKGFEQVIFEEDWRAVRVWIAEPAADKPKAEALALPGSASELHWSPVGSRLAVALAPTPLIDDHYMKRKLHVVDADTGEVVSRIENPGKLGRVVWSPDGKHLAMLAAADLHDPSPGRLMVAPADGGPLRELLPDYQGGVGALAWQDNETVMFVADEGVWTTFGEVRLDGSNRKTIVPTGGAILLSLSLSRGGRSAAFLGQTPRHPTEVYAMTHADDGPRRLTDSNPWLADIRLAPQQVVEFEARDGLGLEGILIRPLDEERGKRYPLILSVHGGPEGHRRNGWLTRYSRPGQVAAARGFAVFYPNYRGGTGRGVAFSKLGQRDPAGKEFDDLIDAVDHLIAAGLVDKDRVGITGGSYGGYASAWGATYYSQRFAAAVMFVGVSDRISDTGTTDIPNEEFLVHTRYRLWDDWQFFLERSPIYHAQKGRTPILILHGKDDPRVPPGQSLEMYRYLRLLGRVPVRLVLYPGEGHGNRKAASRLDYNLRMMRWMEHYLKGPGGDPPPYELRYEKPEPVTHADNNDPADPR